MVRRFMKKKGKNSDDFFFESWLKLISGVVDNRKKKERKEKDFKRQVDKIGIKKK